MLLLTVLCGDHMTCSIQHKHKLLKCFSQELSLTMNAIVLHSDGLNNMLITHSYCNRAINDLQRDTIQYNMKSIPQCYIIRITLRACVLIQLHYVQLHLHATTTTCNYNYMQLQLRAIALNNNIPGLHLGCN